MESGGFDESDSSCSSEMTRQISEGRVSVMLPDFSVMKKYLLRTYVG